MGVLSALEPAKVFQFFEEICSIPHGSRNVEQISNYLVNFAKERGLKYRQDEKFNVVIWKDGSAGYENAEPVILQGHMDMVAVKTADCPKDLEKDGLDLEINGDLVSARGTSLGGDDGIAVAYSLAILDDPDMPHPPLEVITTTDEEIGMLGAAYMDVSDVKGRLFLNMDSEDEGIFTVSCAGGATVTCRFPYERENVTMDTLTVAIDGFSGGHSGVEIDKGRANANVLMGRLLGALGEKLAYRLVKLGGGSRETAIASAATAVIGVADNDAESAVKVVEDCAAVFAKEYATAEPGLSLTAKALAVETVNALTAESTALVTRVLLALPDSVQAMSVDMPGLVQTSLNFGILQLRESELYCANTVRSSMTTQKLWILDKVSAVVALAGGKTEISGSYPGWSYNPNSVVKDTILEVYKELFGKEATVEAVHAGIECGLFADSIPELDCVSIGPDMADVHTPREHLSISSTARTYKLLVEVLARSK